MRLDPALSAVLDVLLVLGATFTVVMLGVCLALVWEHTRNG